VLGRTRFAPAAALPQVIRAGRLPVLLSWPRSFMRDAKQGSSQSSLQWICSSPRRLNIANPHCCFTVV